MVEISQETPAQIENRLLQVIARSDWKILAGSYTFAEFPLEEFSANARQDSLALVRDNQVWSQLVPCLDSTQELFKIFSFHFDNCSDNSGFVGWLASYLKTKLGTGVFVICGHNYQRGGVFDYWGCPLEIAEDVFSEIKKLIVTGKKLLDSKNVQDK